MKNNYIKYIYTLVAFTTVMVANAQVVFNETFGISTVRTTSQYVPQGGNDANLGFSTFTCSSFYKPAVEEYTSANKPSCTTDNLNSYNQYARNISDGYYVVVDPRGKSTSATPSSFNQLRNWCVTDANILGNCGAVLIVNAGQLRNQYYRRGVTLKRNTTYKVSFKVLSASANLPNSSLQFRSKIEIQNVTSEIVLGTSPALTTAAHNVWELKQYSFKTPDNSSCDTNYAISLRNDNPVNSGNDFYIDDIILEEIVDPNAPVINCNSSTSPLATIINANNDVYYLTNPNSGSYSIISNDTYLQGVPGTGFVFNESNKNVSISTVGIWPNNLSLNTSTGFITITGFIPDGTKVSYQICNLLGVCSTATVTLRHNVKGVDDVYTWNSTTAIRTYGPVVNNDLVNGAAGSIVLGTNSTINPKGTWPTGVTLNTTTGMISVAIGTARPTQVLYYTICNSNNICHDVPVIFNSNSEGDSSINTGTFTVNNNILCKYGNLIAVGSTVSTVQFMWQVSHDNGMSWTSVLDESNTLNWKFDIDDLEMQITQDVWIRRKARKWEIVNYSYAYSPSVFIKAIDNEISFSGSKDVSVPINTNVAIPSVTTQYPSTYRILDSSGLEIMPGSIVSFSAPGTYSYSVEVSMIDNPLCLNYSSIDINVYDLTKCNEITEKVYATKESWMTVPLLGLIPIGGVANTEKAIDKDLSTHSTITVALGALGMGTTWHNLNFEHSIPKGTPVTVKLGQEYSAVQLAGGITVYAIDQNNNTIGPMISVKEGALLDLLVGDNVFEFTFIPRDSNGNLVDYYGVRVNIGALVAVASNAKVFEAYYDKIKIVDLATQNSNIGKIVKGAAKPDSSTLYPYPYTNVTLNPLVDDVLWGVEDIGLGVATALSSVVYPYLAADNDLNTFAIFNKSVAALNRQKLTVKFNQIARPGDQIRILMGGFEVPVLDLSLLTDFKIQRYLGNVKVGHEVNGSQFKILDLNLLSLLGNTGDRKALIVDAINQPFDRVEISYLSVVEVGLLGDYTYIYDVTLMPKLYFDGQDPNDPYGSLKPITLCAQDYLKIEKPDPCTSYEIGFAYANKDTSGNIISFTDISGTDILKLVKETNSILEYEFKTLLPEYRNNLYIKLRVSRQGSQFGDYQYMRINLTNCDQGIVNPIIKSGANY